MKKILLILIIGMFISTGLLAKALGEGKMKASISLGYNIVTTKNWDVSKIDISQNSPMAFLTSNAGGLSFSYGLTKDLDLMYSMPIYQTQEIEGEGKIVSTLLGKIDGTIETTKTRTFGSPLLGVIYYKKMKTVGLRIAPYLQLPFYEKISTETTTTKEFSGSEDKEDNDRTIKFEQQTFLGTSLAIDSKVIGKLYWQAWFNFHLGFGGDKDATFNTTFSGLLGYKLNPSSKAKLQLFWLTPDLLNDADGSLDFGDSRLKMLALYGMSLNSDSGFNISIYSIIGLTKKAKMTESEEKATFVGGLTVDYWMTF